MKKKLLAGVLGMFAFAAMGGMSSIAMANDDSAKEAEWHSAFVAQPTVVVEYDSADYQQAREKDVPGNGESAYEKRLASEELSKPYVDMGYTSADFQAANEKAADLAREK